MPQFKKAKYTVKPGKTISTETKNVYASNIDYWIENEEIATVDAYGNVTGVRHGTTKLFMMVNEVNYVTIIRVK